MKVQVFRFGIDTIRFNFKSDFRSPIFDSFFLGLSENSNQKFGVLFMGYEFTVTCAIQSNMMSLYFEFEGDGVFCLTKIIDGGIVRSISYVATFYGAFFYIDALDQFLLKFMKQYKSSLSLSRLDLCLDVNVSTSTLWKSHKSQFRKKQRIENGNHLETFYLGAKKGNKKHFIRVYDKKLDSQKKGKFHLFMNYMEEEVVTRVEVQVNIKSLEAMKVSLHKVIEYEKARLVNEKEGQKFLQSVFASCCINTRSTCFPILKSIDVAKVERIVTAIDTTKRKPTDQIEKVPYIRDFLSRARRIQEMKFDPIELIKAHLEPFQEQVRTPSPSTQCDYGS
ncbi:hypothetical protein KKF55_01685 [Patescibacteria group bacterium]|nr:hypothetical protein [Patescibacteria group bacterium]